MGNVFSTLRNQFIKVALYIGLGSFLIFFFPPKQHLFPEVLDSKFELSGMQYSDFLTKPHHAEKGRGQMKSFFSFSSVGSAKFKCFFLFFNLSRDVMTQNTTLFLN